MNKLNAKGQKHGLWESYYWWKGKLDYKGTYLNGLKNGYWESYWMNGKLHYKGSFVNGERIGYFKFLYSDGKVIDKEFFL